MDSGRDQPLGGAGNGVNGSLKSWVDVMKSFESVIATRDGSSTCYGIDAASIAEPSDALWLSSG